MVAPLLPADLEIRVITEDGDDSLALEYELHSPNGRFELSHVCFPGGRLRRPEVWQERIFKTLEKLHWAAKRGSLVRVLAGHDGPVGAHVRRNGQ